jgi:hypothetical protein
MPESCDTILLQNQAWLPRSAYRGCVTIQPVRVELLSGIRRLVRVAAEERAGWIRTNLRELMVRTDHDAAAVGAMSGVSTGTVRNFLRGTDSSLENVLRMSHALGITLGDLERPPKEFAELMRTRDIG